MISKREEINISAETTVQRNSNLEFSEIEGEVVLLNLNNGHYFALNETASSIWELIEKPTKLTYVVSKLLLKYEISKDECELDTVNCIRSLCLNEIVDIIK